MTPDIGLLLLAVLAPVAFLYLFLTRRTDRRTKRSEGAADNGDGD